MIRTSEQAQADQKRVADADRRHRLATQGPPPAGLTPLQLTQLKIWGWYDQRERSKPTKYAFIEPVRKERVAPPSLPTATQQPSDQQ
jgi:hypothetical protein